MIMHDDSRERRPIPAPNWSWHLTICTTDDVSGPVFGSRRTLPTEEQRSRPPARTVPNPGLSTAPRRPPRPWLEPQKREFEQESQPAAAAATLAVELNAPEKQTTKGLSMQTLAAIYVVAGSEESMIDINDSAFAPKPRARMKACSCRTVRYNSSNSTRSSTAEENRSSGQHQAGHYHGNCTKNCVNCTEICCKPTTGRRQETVGSDTITRTAATLSNWSSVARLHGQPHCNSTSDPEENWPLLVQSKASHLVINKKADYAYPCTSPHNSGRVQYDLNPSDSCCDDQARILEQQYWPSLTESSIINSTSNFNRNSQPLKRSNRYCVQPSNAPQKFASSHHQQHNVTMMPNLPHNSKTEQLHMPPVLLMLDKDFIVTSPLKQNLLLTLALTDKKHMMDDASGPETVKSGSYPAGENRRQVLVGQFIAFSSFLHFMLGHDATRVRTESNAGGTSTISESLSVEYFVRRFQAKDIVTEMEVEYCALNWKKVDYICTLYGQRVGVSVTRAMSFPDPKDFSTQMAYRLLYKKLFGLVVARHGVSKRHSFSQCILHVWCETQETARILQEEYEGVARELDIADDVIMVLTVAEGWHARPIFYESVLRNAGA